MPTQPIELPLHSASVQPRMSANAAAAPARASTAAGIASENFIVHAVLDVGFDSVCLSCFAFSELTGGLSSLFR